MALTDLAIDPQVAYEWRRKYVIDPGPYADDVAAAAGGVPIGGLYIVTGTFAVTQRQS